MTVPVENGGAPALGSAAGIGASNLSVSLALPSEAPIQVKPKNQNIRVSPAVLDSSRKDSDQLLRDLRTSLNGLTQTDAEERARSAGPNEIAQERKQGWFVRVLKIIRN